MIKLNCICSYDMGENLVEWYAINNKRYRKTKNKFLNDRRPIPSHWAVAIMDAWKARKGNWTSSPFDGVYDFTLWENGKPR